MNIVNSNKQINIYDVHQRISFRHKHISTIIYKSFRCSSSFNRYSLFSIAFIWHCHKYFNIDLFDEICNNDAVNDMFWTYPSIESKHELKTFIQISNSILKTISVSDIRNAVQRFEEDNGDIGDIPHGFIASEYNIKHILKNFTQHTSFNINDNDVLLIVNKLLIK